jgi:hypothetical protein
LDRVFLDLKAPFREEDYRKATGRAGVALRVRESLGHLLACGLPLEVRVTVFPEILGDVVPIARGLFKMLETHPSHGLDRLTLQAGMPLSGEFSPVSQQTLGSLAGTIRDKGPVEVEIKVVGPPKARQFPGGVQD